METLGLKTAISQIRQVTDSAEVAAGRSPFFFIVGSGISAPVVPSASEIERKCRDMATTYGRVGTPPSDQAIDTYSHWFSQAMPHPRERQEYLRDLIEGKPISAANLRLAHLLLEASATNLVVTPNFDDFLSRALALFGRPHIVCDHPSTVERIDPERPDIKVVHVHGTYWFYDCCNLSDEIVQRAQPSIETGLTMRSLLDNILSHRSPLVIGYSGWEGDVIMEALRRRLSTGLGYNLYWFCYRRTTVDTLPDWLKSHPNVRFVIPPERPPTRHEGASAEGAEEIGADAVSPTTKATAEGLLSAQYVLDEFVRECGLSAPALTADPLRFYADHLRNQLATVDKEEGGGDLYLIEKVIERIERARGLETRQAQPPQPIARLEDVRDALRRSRYREVVQAAAGLEVASFAEDQLREVMSAAWSAAIGLRDDSEDELLGYRLVVRFGDALLGIHHDDEDIRARVATALVYEAITLGSMDRSEEAVAVYNDVVERFDDAAQPEVQKQVARALFNKGAHLGSLARSEEELAVYEEVVERFGEATDPEVREYVAMALVNKGIRLGSLERSEQALGVYDEVVQRFGDAAEPELQKQVSVALLNKGVRLGSLERSEEELAAYEGVVERFGDAAEPEVRKQVAMALVNKGVRLASLGRAEEEVAVYEEVAERFGEATELELREQVAKALLYKGITLGSLDQREEAVGVYEEIVRRFGEAEEPELREQVEKARKNKKTILGDAD